MTGDDHYGYGSDKLKDDKQRYPQPDVASDADFNSNHGSDNEEESLPAYESPDNEEPQAGAFIIAWTSISRAPSSSTDDSDDCVVCGIKPKHPGYPTCGLTCARKLEASGGSYPTSTRSSSGPGTNYSNSPAGSSSPMCVVCGVRPSYNKGGKKYPTCGLTCKAKYEAGGYSSPSGQNPGGVSSLFRNLSLGSSSGSATSPPSTPSRPGMCVVCGVKPPYSKGGKSYPTCGLSCAETLKASGGMQHANAPAGQRGSSRSMCVICGQRPRYNNGRREFPTCGMTCAEKLAHNGAPQNMCEYCHERPRYQNYPHCGTACREKAKVACLICRCHPKNGKYHFCGKSCKDIATKNTPLLVEARPGHVTFDMVVNKFQSAWRAGGTCPVVKKVYKVVESKTFLQPYDAYRDSHGSEVFRYHGTSRLCTLGSNGQTKLCNSNTCPACSILRTSFNVSLANPAGAFGQGIYTSSAANKSASYSGMSGASDRVMFLNKVILGNAYSASGFAEVRSCPAGYDSVVFDRMNGSLNETIVYRNDAIRPVFLIVFA